jgi:hypothetical protein
MLIPYDHRTGRDLTNHLLNHLAHNQHLGAGSDWPKATPQSGDRATL